MSKQPFDLTKMDYEKQRKLKRRKLFRRSSPAIVIVLLLVLWFGLPTPLTHIAIQDYKRRMYDSARNWLNPLTVISPERFTIAYNTGTVDTKRGKYEQAEEELSFAVSIAPESKQCLATQNLANAFQLHAKAVKKSDAKKSSVLLTKIQKLIKDYPKCFIGMKSGGGGGGGGGSSNDDQNSDVPSQSQQQKLQQKEQEGRDRKAKFASDDAFDPDNARIKRW